MHEKSRWEKCVLSLLVCMVALCVCFSPALAQTGTTGALSGVVTDPSGAVIVGATVTATNTGTGATRTTTTIATGAYQLSLLPPGDYSVKFEAPGFQTSEVPTVTVNVTESPVLNHSMTVGSQTQQVTVEATAESIQTENATVGGLVSGREVTALPLSTRNYTQIMDLSPGVSTNVASATNFGSGTQDVNVNGSSSEHNNYQMEGTSIVNYMSGKAGQENLYGPIPIPNPDAVQEFKVQTSQFDASYGRNSGGNVNVVLKSGTNNYHGSIWEFNRNNFFNANDFFEKLTEHNTGLPNSPLTLKQNTFGGTFGGPIKKDKLFFFASYQGNRQVNGVTAQGYSPGVNLPNINDYADVAGGVCANVRCTTGPSPAAALTAYRAFLGGLYGGVSCPTTPINYFNGPGGTCTFPGAGSETGGNLIANNGPTPTNLALNGSNINPVAINILQATSPAGIGGYLVAGAPASCVAPCLVNIEDPAFATENQYLANLDYHLSNKNTISERFLTSWEPEDISFGAVMPGSGITENFGGDFAVLRLTSILTNNLVNEARGSYVRITSTTTPTYTVQACAVGIIPNVANPPVSATSCSSNGVTIPAGLPPDNYLVPGITISGTSETAAGTYPVGAFGVANYAHESAWLTIDEFGGGDQISWNHGKHSIRTGVDYERDQTEYLEPYTNKGSETFRTFQDFLYGTTNAAGTASALQAVGGSRGLPFGTTVGARGNTIDAYVQDDIKVKSRLTVNIGVRWEYNGLPIATNTQYWPNMWAVLLNQVNTGSFFNANPQGTLAGFVVPAFYPNKANPNFGLVSPTGATGVYVNSNNTVVPNGSPKDLFSPRIGFAYQPKFSDRLVIRGGYGWFHDHSASTFLSKFAASDPPVAIPLNTTTLGSRNMANPFPPSFQGLSCPATGGVCPYQGWLPRSLAAPITITGVIGQHFQNPLVQEYNLGIQYAFKGGWVASVGYIGSHGTYLLADGDQQNPDDIISGAANTPTGLFGETALSSLPYNDVLNPVPNWVTTNAGPGASTVSTSQIERAPYLGLNPGGGYSLIGVTNGSSLYDSLQASLQHQFSHGLSLNVSYTWSKLITDLSGGVAATGGAAAENGNLIEPGSSSGYPLNFAQQYGPAGYNRPQRMVINYSYQLPYKSENAVMSKVLGGWTLSGVTTIQNGEPMIVTDPAGGTLYGYLTTNSTSRAQLADPISCNPTLNICKSGVPYQTAGRIENRYNCYLQFVAKSTAGTGPASTGCPGVSVAAYAPTGTEPAVGGTLNGAGPYAPPVTVNGITSSCYPTTGAGALKAQYVNCGTIFGNSRVGAVQGPSQFNFDMSLSKTIPVTEGSHLEFRAEAFNVWNHTQFNAPASLVINNGNFGKITSVSVPPRIFQFGLKYVF